MTAIVAERAVSSGNPASKCSLGSDILPTGVVPVTAQPTYIKYAPNLMLKALIFDEDRSIIVSMSLELLWIKELA